ncbi:Smr/MutS family protein [Winogradskyella alexanderae]|uniref:DNA mismatch repair protein MutS n=1 Tax=Winogradskyella alexanderae TaxID=2877123 RepID=A0ABS7XNT6_9FLAO|nr:Smr/MutS family protein [Winogradskyella alexanderae]MCA0131665.1 DNA mismatch repair protein MutS [Winogradskyella alexanderae]
MKIKIGDTVETIDDNIKGTVTKIEGNVVFIEDEDGFEVQFQTEELMLTRPDNSIRHSVINADIDNIIKEKSIKRKKQSQVSKPKQRHAPKIVVDLHIHQLTDSTKGMTNFDMLNLQLDTARRQLERAIENRIPKIVFIHGVGEGVLRQELETLFRRYNNVEFYDADYKTYGLGATEVRIFQNLQP